jgi:ornithine cyclodeaminase/alanine dehydrogenase-like protein (mu-crystallin family)
MRAIRVNLGDPRLAQGKTDHAMSNTQRPMKSEQHLFLNEEQVRQHLRMADLIPAMEKALIDFSAGKVTQPVRLVIKVDVAAATGFLGLMPALTPDGLGLKAVTFYPSNAERGIPTHMATIFLVDPETGTPLAIMDGRLITEMRTAAVSAAATKLLASRDAKILAILGSGVQARSHVEALRFVRDFEEIRVWSPKREQAERFAREIGAKAMSAENVVRGADVIVTVTNSKTPVLKGDWLKPGCHVNAIGACTPDWRELDDEAMSNVVFVDSREGALKESGDVILSGAKIYAELGEALAGKVPSHASETTIFKSLGMAVEDIAAATLVYRAVTKKRNHSSKIRDQ